MNAVLTPVVALALVGSAFAGPFEDAVARYEAGDFVTAYRLQRPLAEQGHAKAQVNLGIMYAHGEGVPQNDAEAAKWFRKAADQYDAFAQHNLGVLYSEGRGVPQDQFEAARWFRKAADQGLADAQYDLGVMYSEGRGVPQDRIYAYMWLSLSAAQGDRKAIEARSRVGRDMTYVEIAAAEKLATAWRRSDGALTNP